MQVVTRINPSAVMTRISVDTEVVTLKDVETTVSKRVAVGVVRQAIVSGCCSRRRKFTC